MPLTPEAKTRLSQTIRTLRRDLLAQLKDHLQATYRLAVPVERAGLGEEEGIRRVRLERWLDERVRGCGAKGEAAVRAARERFLDEAVHEAAATLLNRLVYLRLLEHMRGPDGRPLRRMKLVTGGWSSEAMAEFRDVGGPLLDDEGEGFDVLLDLVFDDLSIDLPGLFGPVGVTPLVPVPIAALRQVVAALDDPVLAAAWDDDTTFGWVYQYWNDPKREALDEKIKNGGKIEPHEIASKTQMFTERYMVEWLLQNSLGPTWLAMCRKHGWTPDAERILPGLEARRAEWRAKREAGEVELDALMPIAEGLEDRWKYYVPQDVPEEAVAVAPATLRELKLLDPACGSGHFLVIACDLLFALYQEEARHRGTAWSDREIVEWIVADNLHGIDIDPRAVQIAAAALLLKARTLAPDCRPRTLNLVAPAFDLAGLPDDDPALVALLTGVEQETGLPQSLTRSIVRALAGADHLGTLLKVEHAVSEALMAHQLATGDREPTFDALDGARRVPWMTEGDAEAAIVERLETFLANHTGGPDLGLRLDGEQLAAGVRFMRLVRPGTYHVVVGNPPYQGVRKMVSPGYLKARYPASKADLYSAVAERSIELAKVQGFVSFVSMRGWLFYSDFAAFRLKLSDTTRVVALADLDYGAFTEVKDVAVSLYCLQRSGSGGSLYVKPVPASDVNRDTKQVLRNISGLTCAAFTFNRTWADFKCVPDSPLIYWWSESFRRQYAAVAKVGESAPVRQGMATSDNQRFVRRPWELAPLPVERWRIDRQERPIGWVPYLKGGGDRSWFEPLSDILNWHREGLEVRALNESLYGSYSRAVKNEHWYFVPAVAFTAIGRSFRGRIGRYRSAFDVMGASVFPEDLSGVACLLNSSLAREVLESLNPGVHFQVGDVNRLPLFPIEGADEIYAVLDAAFSQHEAARETSVEFRRPGPSPWAYAQEWAQRAVDRPAGEPLPAYAPRLDPPAPVAWVSYAFGQAMGRFGRDGEGILDAAPEDALAHGILFLSAAAGARDALDTPACAALVAAWEAHGADVKKKAALRDWLRLDFFKDHRKTYENRPIWLPLSSAKRTFVAWVALHRFGPRTLDALRADWLLPERARLEGRLSDLKRAAAEAASPAARAGADREWAEVAAHLEELTAFLAAVTEIAEEGPPPTGPKCPPREVSAPLVLDLDDGVMVNAAALWPLLAPQWKDPTKWWEELARAEGRKDYDWSRLAGRYWPDRVDRKCRQDPSLAVAHGCFWRYHPARAYAWELRLQDEIRPDFTIDEEGSDAARATFLAEFPEGAEAAREKERKRRERKAAKAEEEGPAEGAGEDEGEEGDAEDESDRGIRVV